MKCDSEGNLKAMFGFIDTCLKSLDNSQLESAIDCHELVNELINKLEEYNENSRYTCEINKLKKEYKNTLAR